MNVFNQIAAVFSGGFRLVSNYTGRQAKTMDKSSVKVAICQLTATANREHNLTTCTELIEQSVSQGAKMVFLPEGFDCIANSKTEARESAQLINGPLISHYRDLAKRHQIWLSLGGFKEKSDNSSLIYNTHILLNSEGLIAGKYSKIHLFDVDIPGRVRLTERDFIQAGSQVVPPVPTPAGNLALAIMSLALRQLGAHILTYPSVFTVPTGQAHWEVLLRCRAIENQCYVIAAAQVGQHNQKRSSFGHGMIVDPWGEIICEIKEGIGVAVAEIEVSRAENVRQHLPVIKHRREDIYGNISLQQTSECRNSDLVDSIEVYYFAQFPVLSCCVFYKSSYCYAFVNKKPVLPGHMLVAPLRVVKRFCDLSSEEMADLFDVVKKVALAVEKQYEAQSLTINVQDGPEAGQSVEHVHVHILPRKPKDFDHVDEVYIKLESHDKDEKGAMLPDNSPLWRSVDEMMKEATIMRTHFN